LSDRIQLALYKRLVPNVTLRLGNVPDSEIQMYFNACDAVALGHRRGLNSGIPILAMTFGKPVLGPRMGCIDWVLQQGTNLAYEPGDVHGLARIMRQIRHLPVDAIHEKNTSVARSWRWEHIANGVLSQLFLGNMSESATPEK
jgi:glycosyltransferase involved in cell wall biosynthesis